MITDVLDRKAPSTATPAKLAIADGDIHPTIRGIDDLAPFLEKRWLEHIKSYGLRPRHGFQKGPAYPKGQPGAHRVDAWPKNGGSPGSDLAMMRTQLLDACNIEFGVLNTINPNAGSLQNVDLGNALARALNDWQIAEWTSKEPRLKGSIVVDYEDGQAAAAEIERHAGDPNFVQVLLMSRTSEPLGQRRYAPIFAAAERTGRPVAIHAFGYGGFPITGSGWPSFYVEEVSGHAQNCQSQLVSLVLEGVFEKYPQLKLVMVESGFAWAPSLCWRLDKHWAKQRSEMPHLKRAPSEYIKSQVWFTTQPMEEPERRKHLNDIIDWIGWDHLMFATDYPHWDFDDPAEALPIRIDETQRRLLFRENARAVYGV